MAGQYGKNRDLDFAYWANLGGKGDLTDEEAAGLRSIFGFAKINEKGIDVEGALEAALIQCENLYRVSCLLAYGSGHACFKDISDFAGMVDVPNPFYDPVISPNEGYDEPTETVVKVYLPYSSWYDKEKIPGSLLTPGKYHRGLNPGNDMFPSVGYSAYAGRGYQLYEMPYHLGAPLKCCPGAECENEPYRVIGQIIANSFTLNNYFGMEDGKPVFEAEYGFDALWQTLAELTDKQAPGICPVCGKVVDRRRDGKGGQPKKTCAAHSDKFQNMKKTLQKSDDTEMRFSDKCEEAVRMHRWSDPSLNERPLMFPTWQQCAEQHQEE